MGRTIGTVLACDFRQDLLEALGNGDLSFAFETPVKLRPELLPALQLRGTRDGAILPMNPSIQAAAAVPCRAAERPRLTVVS